MLVRLWLFTARGGNYPEGGTYDTSVLNDQTGNCSDPQQFDRFQNLLQYSIARGEFLQKVSSATEAYTLCSRVRASLAPSNVSAPPPVVGGTGSAFLGGTFEQGTYSPATAGGWCGCDCPGGGVKIPPANVYSEPTLQVTTQPMQVQRVINATYHEPINTIVF